MDQHKLIALARQRIDEPRTHYEGCERDHRECLIQRMADEIERLAGEAYMRTVALCEAEERHEEKLSELFSEPSEASIRELIQNFRFIRTHLYAATVQRSQTDDQIIADHVEQAYRRVNEVIKVMEKRDE